MKSIKHTMLQISLLALLAGTMSITLFAAEPVVPQQTNPQSDGRTTISLNGTWQIAESVSADEIPTVFDHTVVVPGMVNLAKPAFPDVDLFASHEYLIRWGKRYPWGGPEILAKDAPLPVIGISLQKRNYFWYRKTVTAPEKRQVVLLKINKSQFGTKVWLNGKAVGEGRCVILNEYAWLWLYPDGEPIDIAKGGFDKIPVAERQEYRFYITAAMTEMWRSERFAIGVLDYQYLGSYLPRKTGPYHFGDFKDITTLQLHPEFEKYMSEALKPLGVYLKFWGEGEPGKVWHRDPWFSIRGGAPHVFPVVLINDDTEPIAGKLVLTLESLDGKTLASSEKPFQLDGAGRNAYELSVPIPKENGKYLLKAVAFPDGSRHKSPTISLRKLSVEPVADTKANPLRDETNGGKPQANDVQDLLKPQ